MSSRATQKIKLGIKRSGIPRSGKGLFTYASIPAGTNIAEYMGKIISWKDAKAENPYIFYVNRNHVIDARSYTKAFARYVNDAKGICRVKGKRNNSQYVQEGLNVFIQSTRNIRKGEEILVGYGKEYWEVIRHNLSLEKKSKPEN